MKQESDLSVVNTFKTEITMETESQDTSSITKEKMPYRAYLRISDYTELEIPKSFDINIKGNIICLIPKTLEKLIEPKFKVGDRIKYAKTEHIRIVKKLEYDRYILDNNNYLKFCDEHAYKLVKFNVATLKPFDKVLVRIFHKEEWKADFFSHYTNDADHPFVTVGKHALCYCIPYENNEHLLGKTDDCDEFYKTWE